MGSLFLTAGYLFLLSSSRADTVTTPESLESAVAKGGKIVLAPGVYRIKKTLTLRDDTSIVGAGSDKTRIEFGPEVGAWGLAIMGDRVLLKGLTVRNLNDASAKPNGTVRGTTAGGSKRNVDFTAANCNFEIGNGQRFWLTYPDHATVTNCRFISTSIGGGGPIYVGGSNLIFEENVVQWRSGRASFQFNDHSVIRDNVFQLDGNYRGLKLPETGGVELSYSQETSFERNRVTQTGPRGSGDNDGEMILTQSSNVADREWVGNVANASGTKLTGQNLDWSAEPRLSSRHPATRRQAVFLLNGNARGQWRWVIGASGDGLVLDRPWDIVPSPGDQMAISSVTAYRLNLLDNYVEGGKVGISMYSGGIECQIKRNVVKDSGGIVLRADSRVSKRTPLSNFSHAPLWDCLVMGNATANLDGSRPAPISVALIDLGPTNFPLIGRNVRVVDNIMSGKGLRVRGAVGSSDGLEILNIVNAKGAAAGSRTEGMIVKNNAVKGGNTDLPPSTIRM